ncbi:MAG TPA: hypothetical protein ENN45_01760 [Bacteroidetes bacterium]|nr:hypothetical protein [Bacteroidota bacterium]
MDEDIQKEHLEEQVSEGQETTESQSSEKTSAETEEDNKLMGILSYIGVLCLVPLLLKKDDEFVFFHAKQGIVLFIAEVITAFVAVIPTLGWIIAPIAGLIWFILSIIGIVNVLGGNKKELPVLGRYADKIKI